MLVDPKHRTKAGEKLTALRTVQAAVLLKEMLGNDYRYEEYDEHPDAEDPNERRFTECRCKANAAHPHSLDGEVQQNRSQQERRHLAATVCAEFRS